MTDMTPREAVEVLGRVLGNMGDEGYNVTHATKALATLSSLAGRAGEASGYSYDEIVFAWEEADISGDFDEFFSHLGAGRSDSLAPGLFVQMNLDDNPSPPSGATKMVGTGDMAHTMINHECEPHCIGCYVVSWNGGDPIAKCNECGYQITLLDQLTAAAPGASHE